jgi:hypothetical protein
MKVVCMNCGTLIRTVGDPNDEKISHGVCRVHKAYFDNQLKIWFGKEAPHVHHAEQEAV